MAADGGTAPLVKRKEASGADNLLRYFKIEQFCKPDTLVARDYNRDAPGDRSLFRGDGVWSLEALVDWPPVSTYRYEPLSADAVKVALRLQPGPTSLPQAYQGELVVAAPPVVVAPESKPDKKAKKEKKEKKEKKAKKEKKSKEDKKRKRDDTGPEHSSQWTQNTAGTSVS